jgi:hypothetical protein
MYDIHKDARQKERMIEERTLFARNFSRVLGDLWHRLYMTPEWRGIIEAKISNARTSHTSTQAS